LAEQLGFEYDMNGNLGMKGNKNSFLLCDLNNLAYYKLPPPKSLGNEFLNAVVIPLLEKYKLSPEDRLSTFYAHIADTIGAELDKTSGKTVLVTGGGAKNNYLTGLLKGKTKRQILIPPPGIIDFKEAIIFAFLGLLRLKGEINCYASATGASSDSSSGVIVDTIH
jgi:anhydro-N-acetylmuramic acid kinase